MSNFRQVKLQEIVSFKTGKLDSNAAEEGGKYPFFTCSPETLRINNYAFDTTAILLAGNNATGVFPMKYYSGKFNCYQRTYIIENISPEVVSLSYLYFALQLQLKFLQSMSIGAATKFLTMRILNNLKIPLPPLPTQKKIAGILSAYDDAIENNLRRLKLLEEMAQITYEEWFVHLRFPGHATTSINPSTGLPQGWNMEALGKHVKFIKGKKLNEIFLERQEGLLKIMLLDSLESGNYKYTNPSSHTITERGDLVMCMDGARSSYVFYAECGVVGSTMAKIHSETLPSSLLYLFFKSHLESLQTNNTGAAIPHANKSFINNLNFLVPTKEILSLWESKLTPINSQVWNLRDQNQRLREARDIILPRLMTGVIDAEKYQPENFLKKN